MWCFGHVDSKRASRHNGVQFFISHLASWLAPAALASLLFDPPEPQSLENYSASRLSYFFAHLHLLSPDFLFFDLSSSLLFSDSSHLCFSSAHIDASLTSKLLSIKVIFPNA